MRSKPNFFNIAAFSAIVASLLSINVIPGTDDAKVTDFIDTDDEDTDAGGGDTADGVADGGDDANVTDFIDTNGEDTDAGGGDTADGVADGGDDANVTDFIDTNGEDTDAGGGTGAKDDSDDIEYEITGALNSALMAVAGFSVFFSSVS